MLRTLSTVVAGLSLTIGMVATASSAEAVPAKKYKNCTQLNKVYPHGVGKPGAKDKTSGTPVKNFKANKKLYTLN
ncbi:MAG: hypothetical protein ABW075_13720, partial [Aeromicrobium sp.]